MDVYEGITEATVDSFIEELHQFDNSLLPDGDHADGTNHSYELQVVHVCTTCDKTVGANIVSHKVDDSSTGTILDIIHDTDESM